MIKIKLYNKCQKIVLYYEQIILTIIITVVSLINFNSSPIVLLLKTILTFINICSVQCI